MKNVETKFSGIDERLQIKKKELKEGDDKLLEMEKAASTGDESDNGMRNAQKKYRDAQQAFQNAQQKHFTSERDLEMAKIRAQSTWAPLPLSEIIKELDDILKLDESNGIIKLIKVVKRLRDRLTKPNPEDYKPDSALLKAIKESDSKLKTAQQAVEEAEKAIDNLSKRETKKTPRKGGDSVRMIVSESSPLVVRVTSLLPKPARSESARLISTSSEHE